MKKNTLVWILGATFVVCSGAAGLVACSSDETPAGSGDAPRPDAGPSDKDATTKNDTGTSTTSDTGTPDPMGDAGADCGRSPFVPKTTPTEGVRCPFQAPLADGGFAPACSVGQHCCIYPVGLNKKSTCEPIGTECEAIDAGTADFACQENADCAGDAGDICCVQIPQLTMDDRGCAGRNIARGPTITKCRPRAGCAAGETPICTADGGECTTGTCTAFEAKTNYMGTCL